MIKLYLNSKEDQFFPFISKVHPFEQTQLILGCLFPCTAEVCAAAGCAPVCGLPRHVWKASIQSREVQWYPRRRACWDAAEGIGGAHRDWRASSDSEAAVRNREQTGLGVDGRTQRGLGAAAANSDLAVCDQAPLP